METEGQKSEGTEDIFELRGEEVRSLQEYIQHRSTAMLVIMFTDMKGFTQLSEEKGEEFSNKLRVFHDKTMLRIIEENGDGKIIKFIGDAAMAVFSEPTRAVDRALAVQREFQEHLQYHPEFGAVAVRIGLHMGQVTVDNSIQIDVFGRHVNRAARIEGLADGGQIFLTYPVFDSAKGWLADRPSLGWARHGFYALKGISEPIEIIEAYDRRYVTAKPPKSARRQGGLPSWTVLAAVFILGIFFAAGIQYLQETIFAPEPEVYIYNLQNTSVAVDDIFPLVLDETGTAGAYRLQHEISPGVHGMWTVNDRSLYLHTFEVEPGENRIIPDFERYEMPHFTAAFDMEEQTGPASRQQDYPVSLFDDEWNEIQTSIEFSVEIEQQQRSDIVGPDGEDGFVFTGELQVNHPDGETTVPIHVLQDYSPAAKWGDYEVIYESDRYSLEYKYAVFQSTIEIEVAGYYPRP